MEGEPIKLHVVMLPWLAMGHLLPYFELSKRLAQKGVRISFVSTSGNLGRLPSLPPSLSPLFTFVSFPIPPINNLPPSVENTMDLHSDDTRPLINVAYAAFEHHLASFLADPAQPKPDWIIYDFAAIRWAPAVAARFGLSSAFFSLFNAAVISFIGRLPSGFSLEHLTRAPEGIPFTTTVAFRRFEARQVQGKIPEDASSAKFQGPRSRFMAIRTCREFEPEWLDLLTDANRLPVIPVGFLPPSFDEEETTSETWQRIREWLDKQEPGSVVYAAFGTEAKLTAAQIREISIGLERSQLLFMWALREGSPPPGFGERTAGRGLVVKGWAPQARALAHRAVGGFLTHGGWNSVVEGMAAGVTMVVLPMVFDQGLNARHLAERGFALEVERDDGDGSFAGEEIAGKLRMAMVEVEGEGLRARARKGKEVFGSAELHDRYVVDLVVHLLKTGNEID